MRKSARRLHQTCRPVDPCAHVLVVACPLTTSHKAKSKKREEAAAGVKAAQSKPHPEKDGAAKFKIVGMAARVHDRERQESSTHVKGSGVRK